VQGVTGAPASASGTLSGTVASSTASVNVTIPTNQPSVISVSASFALASASGGPLYVEGEEIERVRVTGVYGGVSHVAYVTRSGRELIRPVW
jgi:uncharacterized 2Fe-2S/4Fe-4S cluster protein (DUF4445 family)